MSIAEYIVDKTCPWCNAKADTRYYRAIGDFSPMVAPSHARCTNVLCPASNTWIPIAIWNAPRPGEENGVYVPRAKLAALEAAKTAFDSIYVGGGDDGINGRLKDLLATARREGWEAGRDAAAERMKRYIATDGAELARALQYPGEG